MENRRTISLLDSVSGLIGRPVYLSACFKTGDLPQNAVQ